MVSASNFNRRPQTNYPVISVTNAVDHARSRGFLPQTTRYALDEATHRKLPTPVLAIILDFAFDGVERASKDRNALTKELQEKLIKVLPNKKFHFPQEQVAKVFIHVKSLYLMSPQNQLLKKLLKVTKDALFIEVAPKQGRVITLLLQHLNRRKIEVASMLTKTVVVKEDITPAARKAIAFFVSREVKPLIAALHEKFADYKEMLLDEKLENFALKGMSIKDMYEIQIEVKKCQFFVDQISSKVCQLALVDEQSAKELRQKFLDEIDPAADSTISRLLEILKEQSKNFTDKVKSIYQDWQAPSIADDADLLTLNQNFFKLKELTLATGLFFLSLRMRMKFREKAPTHELGGSGGSVALSDLAAKRDEIMSILRKDQGLTTRLDAVTKEIEAMSEQAKKFHQSAQQLDFTDAYEAREQYAEIVSKFYDELTKFIISLLEEKHDAVTQEIVRLQDSGQEMSIREKQKLEALMAAFTKISTRAADVFAQVNKLLVLE
jgi:hypothetical protein